jgi:hypothetical protein
VNHRQHGPASDTQTNYRPDPSHFPEDSARCFECDFIARQRISSSFRAGIKEEATSKVSDPHCTHLKMEKNTSHTSHTPLRHGFHWKGANNAAKVYRAKC